MLVAGPAKCRHFLPNGAPVSPAAIPWPQGIPWSCQGRSKDTNGDFLVTSFPDEHSQAVATAGTQLPAAASGGDIFKVCLNPAVTEGLVDSDCDAFKVRELINCNPENEDRAHAGSHTPPRPGFSMCAHFHVAR